MKNNFITIKKYTELVAEVSNKLKELNLYSEEILKTTLYNVIMNTDDIESLSKDEMNQLILNTKIDLGNIPIMHNIKNEIKTEVKNEITTKKEAENYNEQKSIIIDYKEIQITDYKSKFYHICPICGAIIRTGNKVFNYEEFDCEKCGGHIAPKYKVNTIYPDLYQVIIRYNIPYNNPSDITDRKELTSFDDMMRYINTFHNIESVIISTNRTKKSLHMSGSYFEYKDFNYARDYISNFLLQNVESVK